MDQKETLTLVKGTFTASETVEILFSLINEKIRFHNLSILGIKEGRAGDIGMHENRLTELMENRKTISDFVATAEGKNIIINGVIDLKIEG